MKSYKYYRKYYYDKERKLKESGQPHLEYPKSLYDMDVNYHKYKDNKVKFSIFVVMILLILATIILVPVTFSVIDVGIVLIPIIALIIYGIGFYEHMIKYKNKYLMFVKTFHTECETPGERVQRERKEKLSRVLN